MATYTRQTGLDFWFDFDQRTLWNREPELSAAFAIIFGNISGPPLDNVVDLFRGAVAAGTYPQAFNHAVAPAAEGFRRCAAFQLQIIDEHLGDPDALLSAFEEFGQGVLFDPRRASNPRGLYRGHLIHMMDGSPADWVGFHRWHAFIRAQIACGADQARWADILKAVALAWGIQTEANPTVDHPSNPGLTLDRLTAHRRFWLSASDDVIDDLFFRHRHQAPAVESADTTAMFGATRIRQFAEVRKILDDAVSGGHPIHDGRSRFWELPLDQFIKLPAIYGVVPIADPGPNRGARSGLVQALKGEPPTFGPGGIPRMPLNRPEVAPEKIALIEQWIDDDCPDEVE